VLVCWRSDRVGDARVGYVASGVPCRE
jgi:hypothetical protein